MFLFAKFGNKNIAAGAIFLFPNLANKNIKIEQEDDLILQKNQIGVG